MAHRLHAAAGDGRSPGSAVRCRSRPHGRLIRLALFACAALAPALGHAQSFERVAPKLPGQPPTPSVEAPPATTPASQDPTILVPQLKGVVFVDSLASLQPRGVDPVVVPAGVAVRGLPVLASPDFAAKVQPYMGRPLTRADVDAIGNLVRETYRAAERPFIDVSVPPQNVQNGIVQVVVTEYRLGKVSVTGNQHFSSRRILKMSDLKSGDVLTLSALREDLDGLNQNPFLAISAMVRPGQETGQSDLILVARDQRPVRFYVGYDNQGVRTLGRDEWNVGVNWGDVFGTGQIFSYQFTRSFSGRYTSHSASDVIPLDGDHRLSIFGAYASQRPEIATGFDSQGHSAQLSGRFVSDLPSSPTRKQNLQVGVDYKRTDNNLEFSGFQLLDTNVELVQLALIYNLALTDKHGQTVIDNTLVYSPGDLAKYNTDDAIRQLNPFSGETYGYDRLAVTRTTSLPKDFTWILRAMGQMASRDLPYSEQIGGGGLGVVRGYDPNTALGSEGVLLGTELRLPAFSPLRLFDKKASGQDQLQFGVFWDYANVSEPRPLPDLPKRVKLESVGVNAHYSFAQRFSLQLEIGSQLRDAPGETKRDTQAAFVVLVGF